MLLPHGCMIILFTDQLYSVNCACKQIRLQSLNCWLQTWSLICWVITPASDLWAPNESRAEKSGDPDDRRSFQWLKNELKAQIRQVKVDYLQTLMQRSRTNPSHAADVWSHVNNVFGRDKHSVSMDSAALNLIDNHFQTMAIISDHENATSFVIPSAVILLRFLRFLSHQCIFICNILMLRSLQGQTVCQPDFWSWLQVKLPSLLPRVNNSRALPSIYVDNIPLSVVSKQKYLGLIFDDALSWSHQVFKVCQSLSYYLHFLKKQKLIFKMDLLKLLIESLVFSHVLYCLPVWGPSLSDVNVNRFKTFATSNHSFVYGSLQVWPCISSFPDSKLVATEE